MSKPETTIKNTAGSDCPSESCSPFFKFCQNNSGGVFDDPAVFVYIEAPDKETACKRTEPHFTLCGDSGMYAEYDSCGCCPCCGHRWEQPWGDKPDKIEDIIGTIDRNVLSYMDCTAVALIKADGSIIKGDTDENLAAIRAYVSLVNAEVSDKMKGVEG